MSIRFAKLSLFDSGPARLHDEGVALRHADQPAMDGRGGRLVGQGCLPRSLVQTGVLTADSAQSLRGQFQAIEALVDGLPHELVDHDGRVFGSTVMLRFEPGEIERLGVRWKAAYRVAYRQLVV